MKLSKCHCIWPFWSWQFSRKDIAFFFLMLTTHQTEATFPKKHETLFQCSSAEEKRTPAARTQKNLVVKRRLRLWAERCVNRMNVEWNEPVTPLSTEWYWVWTKVLKKRVNLEQLLSKCLLRLSSQLQEEENRSSRGREERERKGERKKVRTRWKAFCRAETFSRYFISWTKRLLFVHCG